MKQYPFLDLKIVNARYESELKRVACEVIESGRYINGERVSELEQAVSQITGTPYVVAVSNGLDALRLILRAYIKMGVFKEGDEVLVPANTYIATVLAVSDCRLTPVLCEPSVVSHNIDADKLESYITKRTVAVMPVHLYGNVCWNSKLVEVAKKYSLKVIEDNAQAIGAVSDVEGLYHTYNTGGLGDASGMSFYPTKNVGALGDAGAVSTHSKELADTVRMLANYGSDYRYHNVYAGYNCRMDEIQAAMLLVKLKHIEEENEHRRILAAIYGAEIKNKEVVTPLAESKQSHVWHQYVIQVQERDTFRSYMKNNGVGTDIHYATPPHLQPCYADINVSSLPITEKLANSVVSLPISSMTTEEDAHQIAKIINEYKR